MTDKTPKPPVNTDPELIIDQDPYLGSDLVVDQDPIVDPVVDPDLDQKLDPISDPVSDPIVAAPIIEITDGGMIPIPSRPIVPQEVTPAGPAVVGFGVFDEVFLDKCVYKNVYNRKSLTVHHLQRRLYELGYVVALKDKDGYYGDITRGAVAHFQSDRNLAGDGLMNAETFQLIFANDHNVKVVV
jgi:hypothetical protein